MFFETEIDNDKGRGKARSPLRNSKVNLAINYKKSADLSDNDDDKRVKGTMI